MTAYLPVPCPTCGGLVARDGLRCNCGAAWASVLELEYDGLCEASERAYKIAANLGAVQEVWDAVALERKYWLEIQKEERR
jgi:hypothetical protein